MAKKTRSIKEVIESPIKELAIGITVEKLSAMFFDNKALAGQPAPLYRLDSSGHRYYYRWEGEEPVFYTSVTTMIKNTLPTSPFLIKWLIDKGGDNGRDEAMERASYGTFLHTQCAELLINGKYNLDKLSEKLTLWLVTEKLPTDRISWADELKKDVLAFAQFVIDCNVKPLAIEICLYHPTDGYAGAIDLVCELDIEEKGYFGEVYASGTNKGQPKESKRITRMTAIIDLKSGRKGFYESHEVQLGAYHEMWKIHFPNVPVAKVFNWSPKDFKGATPTYNLKDQTESKNIQKLPYLIELSKIETNKRNDCVTLISGKIDLSKGISGNIVEKTFAELVKSEK
jgi:hypothetical protein